MESQREEVVGGGGEEGHEALTFIKVLLSSGGPNNCRNISLVSFL